MDINQSTIQGNADALLSLFQQAGIGDTAESPYVRDIGDYVQIVHGDIGTGECIQSLLASHGEETTPWHRFQPVIFVMGLFHLKMACADAIWKIFISPRNARNDDTSLSKQVAEIHPNETSKIASKPGFRHMHEIIQHVGIASCLDCWREEICQHNSLINDLEVWAASRPTLNEIQSITIILAKKYLPDKNASDAFFNPSEQQDQVHNNISMREQYFLLYEELSYALNAGDIGHVETCFILWAFIFKGCGKHKYATHLIRFLYDLHYVYPHGLSHAVQMNILCNPTGKPFHYHAIDWLVEHNNLYTKCIYGGHFSNRTKARILKESALIEFENMFALNHCTYQHSPPKMTKTLAKLALYMLKTNTHKTVPGRKALYLIPEAMQEGKHKLVAAKEIAYEIGLDAESNVELEVDGENGDLDV
ncbi:hypothetical protein WOLCODRAFT_88293 [Wolfiporia cocos MD-104 SS10]|uniref:DUF6589 domain-containing protein n=1 Tax=Wolfiporia cocos (strain MD-104) TaxID=742152 RepID=A0A2H3JD12_WOLCO|nr:hypothetical protein WOLCODRAFT_88293 [Wolfiporia cocos MD-104 SS10]